jgi:RimJ/RimL family protein N-acetyltransferase
VTNVAYEWGSELPTLVAPRVRLRWITRDDAPAMFAIFGDAEVMHYWSRSPLSDLDAARSLIDEIDAYFRARTLFQWGIVEAGSDEVIGTCTLFHVNHEHRRAEVGFALGRNSWGKGIANEALGALVEFSFDVLGLHRLEADTDPDNARSIRLLERHGFQREGYLRERWHLAGEVRDAFFFGLLKGEWTRGGRTPETGDGQ